jgi:hypothetical protein
LVKVSVTDPSPILDCGSAEHSRVLLADDHPAMLALTVECSKGGSFLCNPDYCEGYRPSASRNAARHRFVQYRFTVRGLWRQRPS